MAIAPGIDELELETERCLRELRAGDGTARSRLVELHLPLVWALARRYRGRGEPLEDLEQAGVVGLLAAIERFDPARGHDLRAYAVPTVDGEIRRHLRDRASVVRVPRDVQQSGGRLDRVPLEGWDETSGPGDDDPAEDTALTRALVASAARCLDGRERESAEAALDRSGVKA